MRAGWNVALGVVLSLATGGFILAQGQTVENTPPSPAALAAGAAPQVSSQIVERVDDARVARLHGNTHPGARAEFDGGRVDPQLPMERLILVLKRSPEQEAALEAFMARQLDPTSPDYHHWLKPEEFGALYGPSDYDISTVTNWLQNHGFSIDEVANGRTYIEFSGTARSVEDAFHTEIHHFNVNGEKHLANNSDPSIPEALSPVVVGVLSLHNFFTKPLHQYVGSSPTFNISGGAQYVSPYDFATIYNVLPLWNAGIDGTGQTIAIAGRADISNYLSDIATFRSQFGLPVNAPSVILNSAVPFTYPQENPLDERLENLVDVEWTGAVAKGATIKFVATDSTTTTDGATASALYIIDHNVAPIMSFSSGECELDLGTAGNAAFDSMWQQGAAQGITEFVASGDEAASGCDAPQPTPYLAQYGLAVNGISSTPYNVAVGGTDFQWINLPPASTYWSASDNANHSSALGYIPEVPWNDSCASDDVRQANFLGSYSALVACNNAWAARLLDIWNQLLNAIGGTGGASACTTPSSNTPASCSGGYPKPAWQAGTGVPADGKRDVPDVALFAGNALGSAYSFCDSEFLGHACDFTNSSDAKKLGIGGTSLSSPAMAGIMALVLQKLGGAAQGLANPMLYQLASQENLSSCNSNTVAGGNNCVFYDVVSDNNEVPCVAGSPNCPPDGGGDPVSIISGYNATAGYDLATGLGSVNAYNLVNAWSSVPNGPPAMISPVPGSTLSGSSTTFTWSAGTGVSQYYLWVGTTPGGTDLAEVGLSGTSYTVNLPTSGASIYVRLYWVINGQLQNNSYIYTEYMSVPAAMISPVPGSTLGGSSTTFNWTNGIGVTNHYLWIGTTPGGADLAQVGLSGTSYTLNLPTNGATIYIRLYSVINNSLQYNSYTYTEYKPAPAVMISPVSGSTLSGPSTTFTWSTGTGVSQYYLWIGTTPGGADLAQAGTTGTSYTANLPTNGATIYVRLYSVINGQLQFNSYTYTEYTSGPAAMISPAQGSTLTGPSTTFTWNAVTGASQYYLWIGTTPGGTDLAQAGTAGTSYTANLPVSGATIYVRLYTQINGQLQYNSYTYTEYTSAPATMISPVPGSTLTGSSTTFTWNAVTGASQYYLWIGTTPGGTDLAQAGTSGTSYTANLPTNGATIYVRLYTLLNGQLQYNSYTYTESAH